MAAANPGRLFLFGRRRVDQFIKRYAALAGLNLQKAHSHVLKHSCCMKLYESTRDINAIADHVGHGSISSTLLYLRKAAAEQAQAVFLGAL
jgi:site-specific recombinase XerD